MALLWLGCAEGGPAPQPAPATRIFDLGAEASVPRVALPPDAAGAVTLSAVGDGNPDLERCTLQLWDHTAARVIARGRCDDALALPPRTASAGQRTLLVIAAPGGPRELQLRIGGGEPMRVTAGAAAFALPASTRSVELARRPGQRGTPWLYAVAPDGEVVAMDATSGRVGLARLTPPPGATGILAGLAVTAGGPPGPGFRLYANDGAATGQRDDEDQDGDGLGRRLEAALGTCDDRSDLPCLDGPLRAYYARTPGATADTDRDGLDDGDELLGVAAQVPLDLPGWGADPLHKDAFVEVDYRARMDGHGLSADDVEAIAALYATGSANALRNPDGKDGLRLHLDVGFEPTRAEHAGLFGDWGGSGPAGRGQHYAQARKDHFARDGYFRYALAKDRGTGSSTIHGDALQYNRHFHRVLTFAHELGHTLGAYHFGHPRLGSANCKPHYQSIMNYTYQKRADVGLQRGAGFSLNPAQALETQTQGLDVEQLRLPPYELDASAQGIDWNRDGRISSEPVRAAVTWATHKGCAALGQGRRTLVRSPAAATPQLWASGGDVLALYIDEATQIRWLRGRPVEADASGHCPLGTAGDAQGPPARNGDPKRRAKGKSVVAVRGDGCFAFSQPALLADAPGAVALSVATAEPTTTLVAVAADGRLWAADLSLEDGGPRLGAGEWIGRARTRRPPALVRSDDGAVRLAWVAPDSVTWTAVREASSQRWRAGVVRAGDGSRILAGLGPSLTALPGGELCASLPDREHFIRLFCTAPDGAFDLAAPWSDLSAIAFYAGQGPPTGGEALIAFQPYLGSHGYPLQEGRGALYITYTEASSRREPDNPRVLVSEWLDATHPIADRVHFRWRGAVINEWANLAPATGLALLPASGPRGMTGLAVTDPSAKGKRELVWLPAADGAFDVELSVADDFAIMERGICRGLRNHTRCGGRASAAF